MELTTKQTRFVDAIRKPVHRNKDVLRQKRFLEIPRAERLDSILYFFTHSNNYANQRDCAKFLTDVVPDCKQPLEELLSRIAPTWNLSVEEFPHFLADVYGTMHVINTTLVIAEQHAEGSYEKRSLKTIVWWLERRRENAE